MDERTPVLHRYWECATSTEKRMNSSIQFTTNSKATCILKRETVQKGPAWIRLTRLQDCKLHEGLRRQQSQWGKSYLERKHIFQNKSNFCIFAQNWCLTNRTLRKKINYDWSIFCLQSINYYKFLFFFLI